MTNQTITRAEKHIRLMETKPDKLATLDQMMAAYLPICQRYVILFCTGETPHGIYGIPVTGVEMCDLLFSSRRRHTRYWRDWSSDVCSSDLCSTRIAWWTPIVPSASCAARTARANRRDWRSWRCTAT